MSLLYRLGVTDVRSMRGGTAAWKRTGKPLVS